MNLVLLFSTMLLLSFAREIRTDEIPGFFLKVTKNVPRLGRRSGNSFDNYFRKTSKSVPRIGRRNSFVESDIPAAEDYQWYDRLLNPAKRAINTLDYYGYNLVQPMDTNTLMELLSRDLFPSDQLKFIPWKDFDDALQKDEDLYVKIMSLGKDPNIQLKDELKKFVPLYNDMSNNDLFYYRTTADNGRSDSGKEIQY